MTFEQSVATCLRKYATFEGRASRSEYWWFQLLLFLLSVAGSLLGTFAETLGGLVLLAVVLGLFVPNLAVTVRRMHDVGWSGWWLLLIWVPFGVLAFYAIMFWPGRLGANRFGPPPGDLTPPRVGFDDLDASFDQSRIPYVPRDK